MPIECFSPVPDRVWPSLFLKGIRQIQHANQLCTMRHSAISRRLVSLGFEQKWDLGR